MFHTSKKTLMFHVTEILMICFILVPAAWSQGSKITLEDLLSVESPGSPVLSPDGGTLAMTRDGQILLMPAEGGWPATLTTTPGGKSGPAWSPDGKFIAYASQGGIWIVPAAGGAPRRLTSAPAGSGDPRRASDRSPRFSPKGKWILFETGRRGNNDVMVVSQDGMSLNYVAASPDDESSASWSPDGTRISFTERSEKYFSGRLRVVSFDPASGRAAADPVDLYTAAADAGGGWSIGEAAWSPDGKNLAVVLQQSGWDNVYLIPSAGGTPRQITNGEFEDALPAFSPDGKELAVVSNRANLEERHIWIVRLDGSAARRLAAQDTPCMESAPQWSPNGNTIHFLRSTPLEPANLLAVDSRGNGKTRRITDTLPRNFQSAGFKMPEEVHYKSKDGLDIAAILYKPRDFQAGKRYPTVLWIHGGPEGQDGFGWDPWAHYLTQEGYVVLKPNYRGSRGYGERFRNLNVEDSGGGEMDDVAAGAEYLMAQGIADPEKIAIGGGSHGGTMTAYAVVRYPELFAAAVELYGVVDRATYNERTNRNSAIRWMMKMGGTPEEKPEVYRRANVLLDIEKIRTPILIMHGEEDPQVPSYESAQFAKELERHGKKYFYYTYPNEGHGFRQREHRLDAWRKQLSFLRKYLQPRYGRSLTSVEDFVP